MTEKSPPARNRLNRRWLLAGGGAAVIAGVTAPMFFRSTTSHVRSVLQAEFGKRVVTGEDADRFIADMAHIIEHPEGLRRALVRMGVVHLGPLTPFRGAKADMENLIVTQFLKRTNAYRVYAGADDALIYGALDPYEAGCANFLSAPYRI